MSVSTIDDEPSGEPTSAGLTPATLIWAPLLVALIAVAGSLWLSLGMNLKACPLCFYQRTFAMSILGVLGIGVLTGARHRNVLSVLALPLAVGGFGVAAFHVYLEMTGKLECPQGVMSVGTAPQQSLAIFAVLLVLVAAGAFRASSLGEPHVATSLAAMVLGGLFAAGAVTSNPPIPAPPSQPYPGEPEICRPPYRVTG